MEHKEALRDMSVEKYMLGELSGESRDRFEEHLFECPLCAADLKAGVAFAEAARVELAAEPEKARVRKPSRGWADWLFHPQWLVPALAACLALIGYLSFFRIPELKQELALAQSPQVLNTLALAAGTLRGSRLPTITARKEGSFLLSIDLPQGMASPGNGDASYVCSLIAPSGAVVWKGSVLPSQVSDTIQISVPVAVTQAGENTLLIQGVRQGGSGATLDDLARHEFLLDVQK